MYLGAEAYAVNSFFFVKSTKSRGYCGIYYHPNNIDVLHCVKSVYREIPKISPSMYKPPPNRNLKHPPLNCPSEYKPPGGLDLGIYPRIQNKTKQKW